jgi:hypothetical protein
MTRGIEKHGLIIVWFVMHLARSNFESDSREAFICVETSAMKRNIRFVDEAVEEKMGKMLRLTGQLFCDSEDISLACLPEMEKFKKYFAVLVTVEGKVMDIPLPPNIAFEHMQLVDKEEEEEAEDGIMEGAVEEWVRKNIREADIKIRTKVYDKMNGVRLVADIEHDPADYDTWDCCDGMSCSKKENNYCKHILNAATLIVPYDVLAGRLISSLFTGTEWDQHKFRLG